MVILIQNNFSNIFLLICFNHFMIDLEGGPCVAKRLSGCGSGCEYLAVTPWGDFYPCHQFVGNEDFLMGEVRYNSLKLKNPERAEQLFSEAEKFAAERYRKLIQQKKGLENN